VVFDLGTLGLHLVILFLSTMVAVVECCSESIDVVNMLEGRCHTVTLPFNIHSVSMASQFDWLITESHTNKYCQLWFCVILTASATLSVLSLMMIA